MATKTNVDGLKMVCQATAKDLYTWLEQELGRYYGKDKIVATGEYLYCSGNLTMMLCAHVDTVFDEQPSEFIINEITGTMSSPQGIGGDDRCGVYAILAILKALGPDKKPSLFFSTDEEVGGASTKKAAKDLKFRTRGTNYLIELDRQGSADSVYYKCGNDAFKTWINGFGFVEAQGTNTDICTLCKEWDLAGVNFSIGYMDNHRPAEVITFKHMEATIDKVLNIIEATDPENLFPFCEKTYTAPTYNYGGSGVPAKNHVMFIAGDIVKNPVECLGYTYKAETKGKVNEYLTVPANSQMRVISIGKGEVYVSMGTKCFWVDDIDIVLSIFK